MFIRLPRSRRIDDKNRIVYKIENDMIKIVQCGSHYCDKQAFIMISFNNRSVFLKEVG